MKRSYLTLEFLDFNIVPGRSKSRICSPPKHLLKDRAYRILPFRGLNEEQEIIALHEYGSWTSFVVQTKDGGAAGHRLSPRARLHSVIVLPASRTGMNPLSLICGSIISPSSVCNTCHPCSGRRQPGGLHLGPPEPRGRSDPHHAGSRGIPLDEPPVQPGESPGACYEFERPCRLLAASGRLLEPMLSVIYRLVLSRLSLFDVREWTKKRF
jgi:hypothetical protein